MQRRGFRVLACLVRAILIGTLIAFLNPPLEVQAHTNPVEAQDYEPGHVGEPDHAYGDEVQFGHCHPGLDCSLVAALPLTQRMPQHSVTGRKVFRSAGRELDAWVLLSETPPPRALS